MRVKMKQFCLQDKPTNFDPQKHVFSEHWASNFMDRHNFSVRRVTNVKKEIIWERLHKVHNYHWYTQYQMATEDISDISESEEEEEDEVLDAKSDGGDSDIESSSESEYESSSSSESEDESTSENEDEDTEDSD